MFLRSLTLKGFKSFADATTLTFEPGVSVVVGRWAPRPRARCAASAWTT